MGRNTVFTTIPLLLVFIYPEYSVSIGTVVALLSLGIAFCCKLKEPKKKRENPKPHSGNAHFRIFAAVFGLIAAVAITDSLSTFDSEKDCIDISGTMTKCLEFPANYDDMQKIFPSAQLLIIISFFSMGIIFYQCGIMFLSTEAANYVATGNKVGTFVSSLIIFLEGIVLFVAAISIGNTLQYAFWIAALMILDLVWVLVNLFKEIDILFQWLHFDFIMLIFLLIIMLSPSKGTIEVFGVALEYWAILAVFVARTVFDYIVGWEYWSKFVPTE